MQKPQTYIWTEGWTGEVEDVVTDPWPEIMSAKQNKTVVQLEAKGIEFHRIGKNGKAVPCQTVDWNGVKGLIPLMLSRHEKLIHLRKQSGLPMAFVVTETLREEDRFIGNQKIAIEIMQDNILKSTEKGSIVFGTVREIKFNSILVDVGGILTEVPPYEVAHGWITEENIHDYVKKGKTYQFKVLDIDKEKRRMKISLKAMMPNPWPKAIEKYLKGSEKVCTVSGITEYGTFCTLEPGVYGLSQHKQFLKLEAGDKVLARILKVDAKKERIVIDIMRKLNR